MINEHDDIFIRIFIIILEPSTRLYPFKETLDICDDKGGLLGGKDDFCHLTSVDVIIHLS